MHFFLSQYLRPGVADIWLNDISPLEIAPFLLADILLSGNALFQGWDRLIHLYRDDRDSISKMQFFILFYWLISPNIALKSISGDLSDCQSTLVEVMDQSCPVTSHYLSQCWPKSQWVQCLDVLSLAMCHVSIQDSWKKGFLRQKIKKRHFNIILLAEKYIPIHDPSECISKAACHYFRAKA